MGVSPTISHLLEQLSAGDETALDGLVTILYDELHQIAARQLRVERSAHTLQPTALVHEAYLKLLGDTERGFADRVHFLAVASRVMRQILVDYARARATKKRGGQQTRVETEFTPRLEIPGDNSTESVELLDLDRALADLAREDQTLAQLVEMRYFGGMTAEETAAALGRSVHVVRKDLRLGHARLRQKLLR